MATVYIPVKKRSFFISTPWKSSDWSYPGKEPNPYRSISARHAIYFNRLTEILDLGYQVLKYLLEKDVGVAILTKIFPRHMDLLRQHPDKVQFQIGLISLEKDICNMFEPLAANPEVRLTQIRHLIQAGISTQVRIDPILPGISDSPAQLEQLCQTVSHAGVRTIAAATLFLRPAIQHSLHKHLNSPGVYENLMTFFKKASWSTLHAENSPVLALPLQIRRDIYSLLLAIARKYELQVKICACRNTDLPELGGGCEIAGNWPVKQSAESNQLNLFD